MTNRLLWRGTTALVALALIASACGDDDDEGAGAGTSAPAGTASESSAGGGSATTDDSGGVAPTTAAPGEGCTEDRVGGELSIATASPTLGLDPTISIGGGTFGGTEMTALYDVLMRWDPETNEYSGQLAESLVPNADLSEWTLTLRDGITFPSGAPLTADVVEFSVERFRQGTMPLAGLVALIVDIEVVDDLTAVFHLDGPYSEFPFVLSSELGMPVDPAVVAERGDDFNANPAGAGVGPYELVRFAQGEETVLRARDDYWGGPVCIETLRFANILGGLATYEAYRAGEFDVAMIIEAKPIARAREDGVEHAWFRVNQAGHVVNMNVGPEDAVLRDPRLRQAVAHAIDHDLINERVYDGTGLVSPSISYEDGPLATGVEPLRFEPERARELVEEVKADGWDGHLRILATNSPDDIELLVTMEGLLESVGMDVDIENLPPGDRNTRLLATRDYDLGLWGISYFEEAVWAKFARYLTGNPGNVQAGSFSDPALDAAIDELRTAQTLEERSIALGGIQTVWNELAPTVVLSNREWMLMYPGELRGAAQTQSMVVMFDDAYLER